MSAPIPLQQWMAELAAEAARINAAVTGVVTKGALNVKNEARKNAQRSAGRHARRYPDSITYDVTNAGHRISAEIGPDKNKPQGALGNLLEYGSSKNPPHRDLSRALDAEEPRFVAAMGQLGTIQ